MKFDEERKKMVEKLVYFGYLKNKAVIEAMEKVPRHLFVPPDLQEEAYDDRPLPIGEGQTISAPHMVAMMCEALELEENNKVLEVGAGSGYHACVIAHVVKKGKVIAIERIKKLAEKAEENMKRAGCERIKIVTGDGTKGYAEEAPYDRILVTAAAPEIPQPLITQLKPGGILLIPVGSRFSQDLLRIRKISEDKITKENLGGVVFVPLIGEHGWKD